LLAFFANFSLIVHLFWALGEIKQCVSRANDHKIAAFCLTMFDDHSSSSCLWVKWHFLTLLKKFGLFLDCERKKG
jgi:hypothetical protein